jgi:hypothetical protein
LEIENNPSFDQMSIISNEGLYLNETTFDFPLFKNKNGKIESMEIINNKFFHSTNVLTGEVGSKIENDKFIFENNVFDYSAVYFNDKTGVRNAR